MKLDPVHIGSILNRKRVFFSALLERGPTTGPAKFGCFGLSGLRVAAMGLSRFGTAARKEEAKRLQPSPCHNPESGGWLVRWHAALFGLPQRLTREADPDPKLTTDITNPLTLLTD